jgi:hypothetical protein
MSHCVAVSSFTRTTVLKSHSELQKENFGCCSLMEEFHSGCARNTASHCSSNPYGFCRYSRSSLGLCSRKQIRHCQGKRALSTFLLQVLPLPAQLRGSLVRKASGYYFRPGHYSHVGPVAELLDLSINLDLLAPQQLISNLVSESCVDRE